MTASERRASARTAVVWESLHPIVQGASEVLDIGGGTGEFAVRAATLGPRVRVVDPSPDALASLARRAREAGVSERIVAEQGDLAQLADLVEPASVDVVLCHGVLEVVDDPAGALTRIRGVLRPGGSLSLLVAQRHAAVVAKAVAGHFDEALALLDGVEPQAASGARHRFTVGEVVELVEAAGFSLGIVHGIRVFADLVPGVLHDLEPGSAAALHALECAAAERPELLPLAAQVHLVASA